MLSRTGVVHYTGSTRGGKGVGGPIYQALKSGNPRIASHGPRVAIYGPWIATIHEWSGKKLVSLTTPFLPPCLECISVIVFVTPSIYSYPVIRLPLDLEAIISFPTSGMLSLLQGALTLRKGSHDIKSRLWAGENTTTSAHVST